jgi:membrane protein implicated in regulation of membrane protease activity
LTTFLLIGFAGLVLLGISVLLGDLLDGVFDALPGDVFSTAVIGGFTSAFGFGAAIAQNLGAPLLLAIAVGVVAGVGFAWFAAWLTRLIRGGGSDATPAASDALGRDATVLTAIPDGGFGVVRVVIGGHVARYNARADRPVEVGTEVYVSAVLSPTAVTVARVEPDLELPSAS